MTVDSAEKRAWRGHTCTGCRTSGFSESEVDFGLREAGCFGLTSSLSRAIEKRYTKTDPQDYLSRRNNEITVVKAARLHNCTCKSKNKARIVRRVLLRRGYF